MHDVIRKRIDNELMRFVTDLNRRYALSKSSPLLYSVIKDFMLRKGKRVRPVLFIVGYCGYAKREAPGLYTSALSLELLHDFMLVHDDVIDKSDLRRGKPSLHAMLNQHIAKRRAIKFSGQDLAVVAGDVMYAMAIDAFLTVHVSMACKERALRNFIQAAVHTGTGEFIELLCGLKDIAAVSRNEIFKIYDLKTAHYTFASPLTTGAILAGVSEDETRKLFRFGMYTGRAFQIKDDMLAMLGTSKDIGKSLLSDLREAKKTILLWHAYRHASAKDKGYIRRILAQRVIVRADLLRMRKLFERTDSLDYARNEIKRLVRKALTISSSLKMKTSYRKLLASYSRSILTTRKPTER